MSYKLLAIDVDGTLLRRDGSIHDDDRLAIARLRDAGIPVTIVTGRLYSGTRHVAHAVGIKGPVACVDGSHIVHTDGDAYLHTSTLSGAEAGALRAIAERHAPACFLFAQDRIVHDARGAPYAHYASVWSSAIAEVEEVLSHPFWDHDHGVFALMAIGTVSQLRAAVEEIHADLAGAASVLSFPLHRFDGTHAMVVRAAGSTKGTAITWLAAHHGCAPADVVVVGDWLNDVPMFEVAGRSFVMGHAPESVKQAATDRLTAGDGGGIAEAIARAFGR